MGLLPEGPFRFRFQRDDDLPRLHLIGFCGRGFWVFLPPTVKTDPSVLAVNSSRSLRVSNDLAHKMMIEKSGGFRSYNSFYRSSFINRLSDSFEELSQPTRLPDEWFVKVGSPIFVVPASHQHGGHRSDLLTNPRLASLGFEREMDSFTAFQEIAMFLGSQLATEGHAPRTVGDDRIIAASKGFDDQSFRTAAPGRKKENRKLNRARKRGGDQS